jgi:NAD(P)-dependent dehydrogenase (short-subunit alcohol dehydrogenase family)
MGLEGKVALVSGGGTGIGAAVARRFVAEGAQVVVMGRRAEPLSDVARATGAVAFAGSASSSEDARAAVAFAVECFGGLDVVVPNAGAHHGRDALGTDDSEWAASIDSNLTSAFVIVREALPQLIERRGSIVIVGSLASHFAGPGVVGYTTTKHALIGLARSLARDYGPHGVRANVVCPAWTRTPMADEIMDELAERDGLDREGAYGVVTKHTPLRRAATAEEIASVCHFLASDESSAVTGAFLMADGGASTVDLPTIAFAD